VTQVKPVDLLAVAIGIRQRRSSPIAYKKEIAQGFNAGSLLAFSEQCGDRQSKMLTKEIEKRSLDRRDGVNRHPEIECLLSTSARVAFGKRRTYLGQDVIACTDVAAND
jgi:hypothetical protein